MGLSKLNKINLFFSLFIIFLFSSCKPPRLIEQDKQADDDVAVTTSINQLPTSIEPDDEDDETKNLNLKTTTVPELQKKSADNTQSIITKKMTPKLIEKPASKFIKIAFDVMNTEGKSLGTPCNYYLMRVLLRAGYKNPEFRANDFDDYAKKGFKFYKHEDFKIDTEKTDHDELKKYLWSYEERTPFILQWTRPGNYGHVAILERIGDQLIIFQASIGNHTAQRDLTTIDRLLSSKNRAFLTVYSEFSPL